MFLLVSPSIFSTWWNESYLYRSEITISNPTSTSFTNFPVYLEINKSTVMKSDYGDLRFIEGNCNGTQINELDFEIENYTTTHAYVWVELPTLSSSGSSLCMYYNNSAVTSTQNAANTWNPDYGMVYHMDSNGIDSTSNNRNRVSDVGVPIQNTSYMAYGITGDGNDGWDLQNIAYWEQQWSTRSHGVVFTTGNDITTRQVLFAEGGSVNGVMMYIVSGQLYARWWSESQGWSGGHLNTSISANTTYYAAMTYNYPGEYVLYLNNQKVGNVTTSAFINAHSGNGGVFYTGGNTKDFHDLASSSGHYFRGTIHELQVLDIQTSDDENLMKYHNYINYSSTVSIGNEEELLPTIQVIINEPNPAALTPIQQNATQLVNVTVQCNGNSQLNCGRITSYLQYNSSPWSNISTISATTPFWTADAQGVFCDLTGGQNCTFAWNVNATGTVGSNHIFSILLQSNRTKIPDLRSENMSVRIINGDFISFNQTIYTFTPFTRNSGSQSHNLSIISNFGNHTNIIVQCQSGDCGVITENWIDGTSLNDGQQKDITFTCSDSTDGSYSAIFNVTSNQAAEPATTQIDCTVLKQYGPIQMSILQPTSNPKLVGQNQTFTLQAQINCTGECGNITARAIYSGGAFGDGSDGALTVSTPNTIVNTYTYLSGNEGSGNTSIVVNSAAGLSAGDELFIIQMQNGTGSGIAGQYEYVTIKNISGTTLNLETPLTNSFYSGTFNAPSSSVTQVIRVPQYTNVTINSGASITAPAWNGFTGGIVIFRAKQFINTSGYVNVSQKGFRGGDCNGCGNAAWGDQGESTIGIGTSSVSANGIGGGGGYGPSGYSGEPGAGGGHATAGGDGTSTTSSGFNSIGGGTIGQANLSTIFFGGGAGGGGDNDGGAPLPEYSDGGGMALLFAPQIINAKVEAKGEDGTGPGTIGGTSGGGAGGSIWLVADTLDVADVNVSGGIGGSDSDDFSGDGGLGRIRFDYNSKTGANITPGYTGSLLDFITDISTTVGDKPLYSISSNPQSCIVATDGSCTFTWSINATGDINTTIPIFVYAYSNYTSIAQITSTQINISIVDNVIPTITLYSPTNQSNLLHNGTQTFIFKVEDDDSNVSCSIYINGIINTTKTCTTGINSSFTLTGLTSGTYNWMISVTDSFPNTVNSSIWTFTSILEYGIKILKEIIFENTNQYLINLYINNTNNYSISPTTLDFVDTFWTAGSFNLATNFTNTTTGPSYVGDILGWYLNINQNTVTQLNYSISGTGDYNLKKNFIISG
jgi:hypothetical protein